MRSRDLFDVVHSGCVFRFLGGEAAMNVTEHHGVDELYTMYRRTNDARLARRIQAVWLARRGLTCPQIIRVVGASRRTVQQWIAKYNCGGIDELLDKPRSGRPALLNARQQEQLTRRIQIGVTKKLRQQS